MEIITVTLDKERHVKMTLGGMKKFQEATGKSLLKGFNVDELTEGGDEFLDMIIRSRVNAERS